MSEIERFAGGEVNKMLVGNKCDMVAKKVVDFATAKVALSAVSLFSPLVGDVYYDRTLTRTNPRRRMVGPNPTQTLAAHPTSHPVRNLLTSTEFSSSRLRQRRTRMSSLPSLT